MANENIADLLTYQVSSESITLKQNDGYQSESKAYLGYRHFYSEDYQTDLLVGPTFFHQQSKLYNVDNQQGFSFLMKQNLYKKFVYLLLEHIEYQNNTHFEKLNKYGLVLAWYDSLPENWIIDFYAEFFYIPEITTTEIITTARADFLKPIPIFKDNKLQILLEIYRKSGPQFWGGSFTDLRMGLKYQPWSFLSFKAFSTMISSEKTNCNYLEGQINFLYEGQIL